MRVLLSCCLIGMSMVTLLLGGSSLRKKKTRDHRNWSFLFLCVTSFTWQAGAAIQYIVNGNGIVSPKILDCMVLGGSLLSLSWCVVLLCQWFEIARGFRNLFCGICGVGIMVLLFFTLEIYYLFLWFLGLNAIWMITKGISQEENKQERYAGEMALLGVSLMTLGIVLEIVLYVAEKKVFPVSACMIFFTLLIYYRVETTPKVKHSVMG